MSKINRFQRARAIAKNNLVGIVEHDRDGRAKVLVVPGSEGKRYEVIIRRNGKMTTECRLDTGIGYRPCKGNNHSVCYHSIAALIVAAQERECEVAICRTEGEAKLRTRIDGRKFEVTNFHGEGNPVWLVVNGCEDAREESTPVVEMTEEERAEKARLDYQALWGE